MKAFISYSRSDSSFVDQLCEELESRGVEVWRDIKDIMVGNSIVASIENAIKSSDVFCLVLSTLSSSHSWVTREYRTALSRQLSTDGKTPRIFPILIEECEIPELLRDIRYADFRRGYYEGLNELLSAFNLENKRKTPYYDFIHYVENNFHSLSSLIVILKNRGRLDFSAGSWYMHEGHVAPQNRANKILTNVSFIEAVDLRVLVWSAIEQTKIELEEHLQKGMTMVRLGHSISPTTDRKCIFVIVSSGLSFDYGSTGDDDFWTIFDEGFLALIELIQKWRTELLTRKIFLTPEYCEASGVAFRDGETFDFHRVIKLSNVITQVKPMKIELASPNDKETLSSENV